MVQAKSKSSEGVSAGISCQLSSHLTRNPREIEGMRHAIQGRMAKLNSYRELLVWQKSMSLAERCYRMTRRFKRDDQVPQTQVELSKRVEIIGAEEAATLIADAEEVGRMLHGLVASLERTTR
jgi:hypothetical protein